MILLRAISPFLSYYWSPLPIIPLEDFFIVFSFETLHYKETSWDYSLHRKPLENQSMKASRRFCAILSSPRKLSKFLEFVIFSFEILQFFFFSRITCWLYDQSHTIRQGHKRILSILQCPTRIFAITVHFQHDMILLIAISPISILLLVFSIQYLWEISILSYLHTKQLMLFTALE